MAPSRARLSLVDDRAECDRPALSREPLWRHLIGGRFRALRHERGATLAEIAQRARVSTQYLSEIERGVKEPSSEVIAAVAAALGVTLLDLTISVALDLRSAPSAVRPAQTRGVRNAASLKVFALAA